jgi:tetratricopeptide (TPR) repeat protein
LATVLAGAWPAARGTPSAPPVTVPPADAARAEAERELALARTHLARGETRQAEEVLARAVRCAPADEALQLAWVDVALTRRQHATALRRVTEATRYLGPRPALHLRAAQAYFQLGQLLGQANVRTVPNGRAGQFCAGRLLAEARGNTTFLTCPPESALYQVRLALDGGLDTPGAHVLHARIWQRLERPRLALAILNNRAAVLLKDPEEGVLELFAELSLRTGDLGGFLRYERTRAVRAGPQQDAILFEAYRTLAAAYAQRGDEAPYVEWLYRAAQLRPDHEDTLLKLADAEWAAGRQPSAAALYRRLLRLIPDHRERRRMLSRIAAVPQPEP